MTLINEMIPDWLYELSKNSRPITNESYKQLIDKNYTSGAPIKIGDLVLFGMLIEQLNITDGNTTDLSLKIIKFKMEEIGVLYELDLALDPYLTQATKIPRLKFIKDKSKI